MIDPIDSFNNADIPELPIRPHGPFRDHDEERKGMMTLIWKSVSFAVSISVFLLLLALSLFLITMLYEIYNLVHNYFGVIQKDTKQSVGVLITIWDTIKSMGFGITMGSIITGVICNKISNRLSDD